MQNRKSLVIYLVLYFLLGVQVSARAEMLKEFQVNLSNVFPCYSPVATDTIRNGQEEIWILWKTNDLSDHDSEIFLRIFKAGTLSYEYNISDNSTNDSNPTITSSGGIIYMGYESYNEITRKSEIIICGERDGHSFKKPLNPVKSELLTGSMSFYLPAFPTLPLNTDYKVYLETPLIVSESDRDNHHPSIVMDSTGLVHVVWDSRSTTDSTSEIYYCCFNETTMFPAIQVNDSNDSYDGYPKISLSAANEPLITWEGFDGHDMEIYYRKIGAAGLEPTIQITDNDYYDTRPNIAQSYSDTVSLAWEQIARFDHNIMAARLLAEYSDFDLLPYTVANSRYEEMHPVVINKVSEDTQAVYQKKLGWKTRLRSRMIGDKVGDEQKLPTDYRLSCSGQTAALNQFDEIMYFYEGSVYCFRNVFILAPESMFRPVIVDSP
jgi:hypothetical protein